MVHAPWLFQRIFIVEKSGTNVCAALLKPNIVEPKGEGA